MSMFRGFLKAVFGSTREMNNLDGEDMLLLASVNELRERTDVCSIAEVVHRVKERKGLFTQAVSYRLDNMKKGGLVDSDERDEILYWRVTRDGRAALQAFENEEMSAPAGPSAG